jgi:hypothetical protein
MPSLYLIFYVDIIIVVVIIIIIVIVVVTSRSVPEPDVFLLPVQSVGAFTSLLKMVFCLQISF